MPGLKSTDGNPKDYVGLANVFLPTNGSAAARMGVEIYITVDGEENAQLFTVTEAKEFLRKFKKSIKQAEDINKNGH